MSCCMASSISFSIFWARRLAGLRAESALHVSLAQDLAEIVVDVTDAALPARFEFLRPTQGLAEEIEIGVHKCRGEIGSVGMRQVPAQVSLPAFQVFVLQH